MINNSIANIAHSILTDYTNILYSHHNSLFDCLFKDLKYNIYGYNDQAYAHYYDLCIANNFLNYHNDIGILANQSHIKNCLFFHDRPPETFKKEDIALAQQNINKIHKIVFGTNLADSWKMQPDKYTTIIEYGLPQFDLIPQNRTKSVIILNLNNNQNISMLYQHIKAHIDDCDMLEAIPQNLTIRDIYNILSQYRICIDVSNTINTLVSMCCGCQTITSQSISSLITKNKLISYITDYSNIVSILQVLLNINLSDDEREHNQRMLTQLYNYDTFLDQLYKKIQYLKKQEPFIYE